MAAVNVPFEPFGLASKGWDIFKGNVGPLLGGFVVLAALISASAAVWVGPLILTGPLMVGYFKMIRDAAAGRPVQFGDLFYGFQNAFLPAMLVGLVSQLLISLGLVLCILPGLFLAFVYWPVYLVLLDGETDFWKALETSRKLVMDNFVQWIWLQVVLDLLVLAGVMLCCVGVLVAFPVALIMTSLAYDMQRRAEPFDVAAEPVESGAPPEEDAPPPPPAE